MGRPAVLAIRITADAAQAQRGAQQAQGAFSRIGSGAAAMGKKIAAGFGAFAAVAGLTSVLSTVYSEGRRTQDAVAVTAQRIGQMGGAANVSAAHVNTLAKSLSRSTGITRTTIQESQNLLLTFGNIKNGVGEGADMFDQASKMALDMSVALGVDAKQAAMQLGKALNDPVKGITALSRAGVSFTEGQKEQIKALTASGDLIGAQKIIMGELGKQVGGTAETVVNNVDKLKAGFQDWAGEMGTKLLPYLDQFAGWLTSTAMPALESFGATVMDKAGPAVAALGTILSTVVLPVLTSVGGYLVGTAIPALIAFAQWAVKTAQDWAPLIAVIGVFALAVAGPYLAAIVVANVQGLVWLATMGAQAIAMNAVRIATTVWTAAQWLLNAALTANPVGLVIAALAALAIGIYTAYQKSETFRAICDRVWAVLKQVGGYIAGALVSAFRGARDAIGWVIDKARSLIDWLGRIKMPKVLSSIGSAIGKIFGANTAAPLSAGALYGAAGGPGSAGGIPVTLTASTHVYVTIDGQQLQGRITRSITGALNAEGARYTAGGWA